MPAAHPRALFVGLVPSAWLPTATAAFTFDSPVWTMIYILDAMPPPHVPLPRAYVTNRAPGLLPYLRFRPLGSVFFSG